MSGHKIIEGLDDAIAYAKGDKSRARETTIMVPAHPEGVLEPIQCHRCGKDLSAASGYAMNATCDLFFCLVRCHAPEPASPPPADREVDRRMVIEALACEEFNRSGSRNNTLAWERSKDSYLANAARTLRRLLALPPAVRAALSRLMGQG